VRSESRGIEEATGVEEIQPICKRLMCVTTVCNLAARVPMHMRHSVQGRISRTNSYSASQTGS